MLQNFTEVAHVDPATARRALNEVLPLVAPFPADPFADDGLASQRWGRSAAALGVSRTAAKGAKRK